MGVLASARVESIWEEFGLEVFVSKKPAWLSLKLLELGESLEHPYTGEVKRTTIEAKLKFCSLTSKRV